MALRDAGDLRGGVPVGRGADDRVGGAAGIDSYALLEIGEEVVEQRRTRVFVDGHANTRRLRAAVDRVVDDPAVGHSRQRNVARVRVAAKEDAGGAAGGDDVVGDHHARHEAGGVEHRQARRHALVWCVGASVAEARVDADAVGEGIADRVALDQELPLLAGLVSIAKGPNKRPVAGHQVGVGVDRLVHPVVRLDRIDLRSEFGATADLKLVAALQALRGDGRRRAWRACREEVCLAGGGAGDHLASLGEANDDVVDVEALVAVVLAAGGFVEVAGSARDAVDLIDEIAAGIPLRRVHFASGAEVESQAEVGLVRVASQIDPGLPPRAAVEQLLDVLVRVGRHVGRHRGERRQFSVGLVRAGEQRIVGRYDGPRHAAVRRDEGPGTVRHTTVRGAGCIVLGLQPVVEIERRPVGILVAREAEGIRRQAAVGAAREVVGVGNRRIRRQILLPSAILDAVLPVSGLVIQIVRAAASILLEPEVHAHATLGLDGVFIVALCVEDKLALCAVAGVVGGDTDAVAGVGRPFGRGMPEVDVEWREGEARGAADAGGDVLRVGDAVAVTVEDRQECARGVKRPQCAAAVDRKQRILQRSAVEILGPERQAAERHCEADGALVALPIDLQGVGYARRRRIEVNQRGKAGAGVDGEEITVGVDAVELTVHELHAGHEAEVPARILDGVALAAPRLPRDGGGGAIRWIRLVEPRAGVAGVDRVEEIVIRGSSGPPPGDGIDSVCGEGVGGTCEAVGDCRQTDAGRLGGAVPDDGKLTRSGVDVTDAALRQRQAGRDAADGCERDHAVHAGRKRPRARPENGVRVIDRSSRNRRDAGLRQRERGVDDCSSLLRRKVRFRVAGARRHIGNRVVAKRCQRAGAGIDQADLAGGVGRAGEPTVAVELAVRTHGEIGRGAAAERRRDRSLDPAPHRIDRLQAAARGDEERHVAERERRDMRREVQRVDQGAGRGGYRRTGCLGPCRVAREADVVLDDAVD